MIRRLLGITLTLMLACGQAWAIDLGIEDQAEYERLVDAIRAAEYVRNDMILADGSNLTSSPKPRVYAVLAAVMVYSERNPNASDAQLAAFLQAFDAAVQAYAPADPDLNLPVTLNAAVRFAVVDDVALTGTDTAIGEQVLERLGVVIPDVDSFLSLERRMAFFEFSFARGLNYRNEVFDLLVAGFFGRDATGNERMALPATLHSYLQSEGFDSELGSVSVLADRLSINDGLDAVLPATITAYEQVISNGPENDALKAQVQTQLNSIRAQINNFVGTCRPDYDLAESRDTCGAADRGTLYSELIDPSKPGLAESIALASNDTYVEQVRAERRAELQATARARAAASAATMLMLQSENDAIGTYASVTRDYSEIALETNECMADLKNGVLIATSLVGVARGIYTKDPVTRALSMQALGGNVMELVGRKVGGTPSIDEQTFNQVAELRQQVEEMRQEMNVRFA